MTTREAHQLEALTDRMDEEGAGEPTGRDEVGADPPTATTRLPYGTVSDKKFASKRKKEANALKHFQCYLKKRDIKTLPKDIPVAEIDHDLIGGFLKYLAEDARKYLKEDGELLSMGSATGYASSIKVYLCSIHRDRAPPPTLAKENWSILLREMSTILIQRHKKDEQTFDDWKKSVQEGFVRRNRAALPINYSPSMEQCLLDPRTFLSSYNALAIATASIHRK
jgi:hypothetical protein